MVNWGVPWCSRFIRAHWIHQGGSTGVNGFIRVRPVGRLVLPGSLRSLGCALGVVGLFRMRPELVWFIRGRWVHRGSLWGSSSFFRAAGFIPVRFRGFIPGRWVHWGSPWCSSCSSGFAGFIGVVIQVRWVNWCAPLLVGFIWVHMGASWGFGVCPEGRRVRAVSQCLLECSWGSLGLCVVAGFIGVRPGGRGVHPCSLGCDMGVVVFIQGG